MINRLVSFVLVVAVIYLPIELIFNGFELIPYILIEISIFGATIYLNHKKWFNVSRIYFFFSSLLSIIPMMYVVPVGAGNEFLLLPIALIPPVVFNNKILSAGMALLVLISFFIVINTREFVEPIVQVTQEQIDFFRNIYLGIVFFLVYNVALYFRVIVEEYESINITKNELLNNSNADIKDSINYAKKIQDAILPSKKLIKKHLPNSFVLYLPKDIIAGDFYWMQNVGDHVLYAAADCTGHGVPGAMVSVVCSNALNQSVRELNTTNPAEILEMTRKIVKENLCFDNDNVKDGMDIALCSLNTKTNNIQFTGAYNPLYIIRNKELIEIKGDKQPVGSYFNETPFTNHTYQLESGDTLYTFSDGFADQFGGTKCKKFLKRRFKESLLKIVDEPIDEQQQLLIEIFENWKGDLAQLDDICVIGVKIT